MRRLWFTRSNEVALCNEKSWAQLGYQIGGLIILGLSFLISWSFLSAFLILAAISLFLIGSTQHGIAINKLTMVATQWKSFGGLYPLRSTTRSVDIRMADTIIIDQSVERITSPEGKYQSVMRYQISAGIETRKLNLIIELFNDAEARRTACYLAESLQLRVYDASLQLWIKPARDQPFQCLSDRYKSTGEVLIITPRPGNVPFKVQAHGNSITVRMLNPETFRHKSLLRWWIATGVILITAILLTMKAGYLFSDTYVYWAFATMFALIPLVSQRARPMITASPKFFKISLRAGLLKNEFLIRADRIIDLRVERPLRTEQGIIGPASATLTVYALDTTKQFGSSLDIEDQEWLRDVLVKAIISNESVGIAQ